MDIPRFPTLKPVSQGHPLLLGRGVNDRTRKAITPAEQVLPPWGARKTVLFRDMRVAALKDPMEEVARISSH